MASKDSVRSIVVRIYDSGPSDPSNPDLKPYHIQTNNTIVIDCPDPNSSSLQDLQAAISYEIETHYQMTASTPCLVAVWQGNKRNSGMRTHITEANVPRILDLVRNNPKLYLEAHLRSGPLASNVQMNNRGSVDQKPVTTPHSKTPPRSVENAMVGGFTDEEWNILSGRSGNNPNLVNFDQFAAVAQNVAGMSDGSSQPFGNPGFSNFNDSTHSFGSLGNTGSNSFGNPGNTGSNSFGNPGNTGGDSFSTMGSSGSNSFDNQPNAGNTQYRSRTYPGLKNFGQGNSQGRWYNR
ncbi:MAG: hypothetical protein M1831_007368 [Alyxoria varia]|nr:MAG: hypothetical protein M1831_007368 [Alyxoria varia]